MKFKQVALWILVIAASAAAGIGLAYLLPKDLRP